MFLNIQKVPEHVCKHFKSKCRVKKCLRTNSEFFRKKFWELLKMFMRKFVGEHFRMFHWNFLKCSWTLKKFWNIFVNNSNQKLFWKNVPEQAISYVHHVLTKLKIAQFNRPANRDSLLYKTSDQLPSQRRTRPASTCAGAPPTYRREEKYFNGIDEKIKQTIGTSNLH